MTLAFGQIVKATHVNLVDFIERRDPEKPVKTFASQRALSKYTLKHEKIFPKRNVHEGSLLRDLLRQIFRFRPAGQV